MKHLLICLTICTLSPAFGMEDDPAEYLKARYTLTNPIPKNRLWTDPPEDEKDYVISDPLLSDDKPPVIPQNFTLKEDRFVKYVTFRATLFLDVFKKSVARKVTYLTKRSSLRVKF